MRATRSTLPRGRLPKSTPEPIPDTPENLDRVLLTTSQPSEWDDLKKEDKDVG